MRNMFRLQVTIIVLTGVFTCLVATTSIAQVQPQSAIVLHVLNETVPGTTQIVVIQGDPVIVEFEVDPEVYTHFSDKIQLRRLDDSSVVSEQIRGYEFYGIVLLDTISDNALGELEVVYVSNTSGGVLAVAEQTVTVIDDTPSEPPELVEVPPGGTIMEAINMVADGGTVIIGPGTYEEQLIIIDKQVNIVGSGSKGGKRTEIVASIANEVKPPAEVQGIVTYIGGGGSLQNIAFSGGDAAVVSIENNGILSPLEVEDVVIREAAYGIMGSFSSLTVKDFVLTDIKGYGVMIFKIQEILEIMDGYISNCIGIELLVYNLEFSQPGSIHIIGNSFEGFTYSLEQFTQAGILVVGDAKPVYIINCEVGPGQGAGIFLFNAGFVEIMDTSVHFISNNPNSSYSVSKGWGLIAFNSYFVEVVDSMFSGCDMAGM
ncbi:MAG: DUF1565 domain-containing protein, partial [Thermoplasmata archaeon]